MYLRSPAAVPSGHGVADPADGDTLGGGAVVDSDPAGVGDVLIGVGDVLVGVGEGEGLGE